MAELHRRADESAADGRGSGGLGSEGLGSDGLAPIEPGPDVAILLRAVVDWATETPAVVGVAVVGSHARGTARPDSDVDLVLICDDPARILTGDWIWRFGAVRSVAHEDYGALQSLRVFFDGDLEVEFGITGRNWAALPLDPGTRSVIMGGVRILYDPDGLLHRATSGGRGKD
ncbi:MAG: nucleotidyltransferase domain-containing protein [Candidatus Eisenbacteria bacterium]|uniref:Nucleotidyltransferase domain-containing protein n=1 Tax=Eiseniibacteriota bacterium TaxID=2212470 RepID=A0A956LXS7_UNCEI|nr:nucleotidyltransferase domain-containing protein [Candidatus Eisenbacteria bacterium]